MEYINLREALIEGDAEQVLLEIKSLLSENIMPETIIGEGMLEGMKTVGMLFKSGEKFLPEVMMSAQAMTEGVEYLKPLIEHETSQSKGVVVIGTVRGDLHDIGKNLVAMFMRTNGFEVIDLGTDVEPEQFLDIVQSRRVHIVALSALLTTTMETMKEVIDLLNQNNQRRGIKVIVGGAPLSEEFAARIGADGYAGDAASAVELCTSLMAEVAC